MRHTWTQLGFCTIVLGALSAAPSLAQNSDGTANKATAPENATEILKELRALNKRLDTLERNLENDLRELRSRGTQTDLATQTTQKDVNDLKSQLDQLRRDIDSLNRRLGPVERIATYAGPAGTAAPTVTPPPGRVRIVNTYFLPETVVVNGKAYTVAPNQDVYTDPIAAGPFSYEVMNVQARQDRILNPGETFSIYVHPR